MPGASALFHVQHARRARALRWPLCPALPLEASATSFHPVVRRRRGRLQGQGEQPMPFDRSSKSGILLHGRRM